MQYAMIYSIYIYRVHTCTVYKYVGHSAVYDRIISRCMTRVIHILYRLYVTSQSTARPSRTEILLHPAATPGQPTGQLRPASTALYVAILSQRSVWWNQAILRYVTESYLLVYVLYPV